MFSHVTPKHYVFSPFSLKTMNYPILQPLSSHKIKKIKDRDPSFHFFFTKKCIRLDLAFVFVIVRKRKNRIGYLHLDKTMEFLPFSTPNNTDNLQQKKFEVFFLHQESCHGTYIITLVCNVIDIVIVKSVELTWSELHS